MEKNKEPFVSVIMAAYNSEKYIAEAIESILNQSYHNLELIIVEDAATDHTLQIIQSFSDNRIRLLSNKENRGTLYSMRRAVRASRGELIAVLDSDDVSYPTRIEKQVSFLQMNPRVLLCGTKADILVGGKIKKGWGSSVKTLEELHFSLLFENNVVHSTVMFRKEELEKRNIKYSKFSYCHDYNLILETVSLGQVCLLDEVLGAYRIHNEQKTIVLSDQKREKETRAARKKYVIHQKYFSKPEKIVLCRAIEGELEKYWEFKLLEYTLKHYIKICGLGKKDNFLIKQKCSFLLLQQKDTIQRFLFGLTSRIMSIG